MEDKDRIELEALVTKTMDRASNLELTLQNIINYANDRLIADRKELISIGFRYIRDGKPETRRSGLNYKGRVEANEKIIKFITEIL